MATRLLRYFSTLSIAGILVIVVSSLYLFTIRTTRHSHTYPFVNSFVCQIPDVDPFDKSIARLIQHNGPLECMDRPSITYEDGNMIRINWRAVEEFYNDDDEPKYCRYQSITRGPQQSDFHYMLGNPSEPFLHDLQTDDEYIKIHCFNESDDVIYTNFHALLLPDEETDERCDKLLSQHHNPNNSREMMSVLMIGIDSVSRLNSIRQMPSMRKYLLEDLEAIEFRGYTKVADNTFVNVVPILTGKFVEELPWNETLKDEPFDKYNFIWKDFSREGYRTLYAEDAPYLSAFNYLKGGFHQPPTDFYPRAFSVAMEMEESVWNNSHQCVGDRLETEILLKYVGDFAMHYPTKPYFGFTFMTRLTHDNENDAGAADQPHLRFLQRLNENNLLNNTAIIYFSDHGMRFGQIRNTYIGKVEERMPFLIMVVPKWFKKKYPNIIENMKTNSERLTTPFDLHETLRYILDFKKGTNTFNGIERGISLFNDIPRDRSCDDASIMPHWCMCLERKHVSTTSELVQNAGIMILNHINEELFRHRHLCSVLQVREIQTAVALVANTHVLKFENSINDVIGRRVEYGKRTDAQVLLQVSLTATPGGGIFEGTVKFDEANHNFTLAGDISRINKYGNQSICIDDFDLKKYCFCK